MNLNAEHVALPVQLNLVIHNMSDLFYMKNNKKVSFKPKYYLFIFED